MCLPNALAFAQGASTVKPLPVDNDLKIPRYNIGLTIQSQGSTRGVLAERMVQTQLNGDLWQVNWLSVTTATAANASSKYPVAEVKTKKGILEGPMVGNKTNYFHALLWPEGYTVLGDALPLWVDASYLDVKKNQSEFFSLGFLKVDTLAQQSLDAGQYQELLYFRNLYEGYAAQAAKGKSIEWLKTFDKNFFSLTFLRASKTVVKINGISRQVNCKVLGNRYFAMTVLDQYDNPLVLALEFFPDQVPQVFARSFAFLQKNFEFHVTQIQF